MSSIRERVSDSLRIPKRDMSVLVVAAMLAIFALAMINSIIPAYHEQQAMQDRKAELQTEVDGLAKEQDRLKDEIEALDDPYYIANWLIENYRYRMAPMPEETATTERG